MGDQFQNKQYDPKHFNVKQYPGGGATKTPATCDGTYYANRSDIELIFGKLNTSKWADVDNLGVAEDIDARVCWALLSAEAYLNDMLNSGPHSIPFVAPFPVQIIIECARKAGCILYDSRGVTDVDADGKPQDSLKMHRDQTQRFITRIVAGQMQLVGVPVATSTPGTYIEPFIDPLTGDIWY